MTTKGRMYGPYPAIVEEWIDGDTARVALDLGFGVYLYPRDFDGKPILSMRVYGINAPEISTDAGKQAKAYGEVLCPNGTKVSALSHGWDKYGGRWDGTITLPGGQDYATQMVAAGQAVPYFP